MIKDYESAFDAVTLIQIPLMIYLSDFQPLSITKIKIFFLGGAKFVTMNTPQKFQECRFRLHYESVL